MPQNTINEIIQIMSWYKETIWLILTWTAWSITHIFVRVSKWEKMTFMQNIWHLFISGFAWQLCFFICSYFHITWSLLYFIIWMSWYLGIQIMEALSLIKASDIYEIILLIKNKIIWKK
jgi:hypothetical protein